MKDSWWRKKSEELQAMTNKTDTDGLFLGWEPPMAREPTQ